MRAATLAAMNEHAAYLGRTRHGRQGPLRPGRAGPDVERLRPGADRAGGVAAQGLPRLRHDQAGGLPRAPGRQDARSAQTYKINNHNTLLYNYDGTIGVKNGYTDAANRTFISAVTRGGKTYLLTEMYGLDSSWRSQAAMYDWAFTYGARAGTVGELVAPGTVTSPPTPSRARPRPR